MTREAPPGLDDRGLRLWAEVWAAKPGLNAGEVVVLEEVCRLADRLDWFDEMLSGDEAVWATIKDFEGERPSVLIINSLVSEARQHVTELRQAVKALALPVRAGVPQAKSELELLRERKGQAG